MIWKTTLAFFVALFFTIGIHAQTPDLRDCTNSNGTTRWNCPSNNFTLDDVYLTLVDESGNIIDVKSCTSGVVQTAYVYLNYTSNANSPIYQTRVFADLVTAGISEPLNVYLGQVAPSNQGSQTSEIYGPFDWECGTELRLENILIVWNPSFDSKISENSYECTSYGKSQCEFGTDTFIAAPLAVQFDYSVCRENGTSTIDLTSTTNGGKAPYSFSWSSNVTGTFTSPTGSSTSFSTTAATSPIKVTLTVIDSDTPKTVSSFDVFIVNPNELSINETKSDIGCDETNTGSIDISVTGGTGSYTYSWTGPDNFSSSLEDLSGLMAGIYEVTVADEFGCSKNESFTINKISAPSIADAGDAQSQCNDANFTLAANDPSVGTGLWTVESGTATINDSSAYNSSVIVAVGQTAVLKWTITNGDCTSSDTVSFVNNKAPKAPASSGDITECEASPLQTLNANDVLASTTGITWYTAASGGTVVENPTLSAVGDVTYYAEYNDGTCTSLTRTAVTLTITGAPEAPASSGDITECEASPLQTLNANEALASTTGITWYTAATGGTVVENPTLSAVGDVTYYAEYNDGTCTSLTRTAVTLTITGAPEAPASSGDITECEASPLQTLNANQALASTTGITWYTAATGGTVVENPTLNTVGDVTYYAEYNDGTCTSLTKTAVTLTITGAPEAPASSGDITECEASPLQTLNANTALASTTGITWYTAATDGTVVENPTLNAVGDVTYYAEYNDGTCTSLTRTAVTLTITGAPEAPASSGDITECEASPLQTLNANEALASTTGITWYTAATGGTVVENPTLSAVGDVTYYAEYNDGTCTSLTRTAVTLTITGAPEAPASSGDITECEASPLQTLNANQALASTTGITWYTAATGGTVVENPTLNTVGDVTYYAEYNDGTCTSLSRTAVKLTITDAPAAPQADDQTVCFNGDVNQTLTATATGGTITWYDAATGGNVVSNPTQVGVGTKTYYAESKVGDCISLSRTAVVLTISDAPAAPQADDQTVCYNGDVDQTLTATATGGTITWYDAATGGNIVSNPTQVGVGTKTYYAESKVGDCVSLSRTAVKLTITDAPAAPQADDQTVCYNGDVNQTLTATATGGTITWYDAATGGNIVSNPTQIGVGTKTYYAESKVGDCVSLSRTAVKLTITDAPAAPQADDQTVCFNGDVNQTLTATATGGTITWYDAATGGNVVSNPTQIGVGTKTYYAESKDGDCVSLSRTAVVLTITEDPEAPVSNGDITECEASPLQTLNANTTLASTTGITWYTAATDGTVVENPTLSAVGDVTYYAEYNDGTCTSLTRTAVTLTITGAPEAPASSGDITECEASPLQTLNANEALASTTGITWYTAATGGTVVENPTLSAVGDVTYYAEYNDGTCTSLTRTAVTLTITGAPEAPASSGDITECEASPLQTLNANQALASTTGITWYTAATGGTVVENPTLNTVGDVTYYAEYNDGTCTSLSRTAVKLTITDAPAAPQADDQTVCFNGDVNQTLTATATGGTITWYDAATGGNVVSNPTQVGVGTKTYYAESKVGDCISLSRTAVVLTISDAPAAPQADDQTVCFNGDVNQTLTATATGGTITWYDAATGGNVVSNPTQIGVGTKTYYAESKVGDCVSLSRTAVVLTITEDPEAPVSNGDITECEASPLQTLNANDALASTTGIIWYTTATGDEVVENPTLGIVGEATYYAEYNDGNCTSLTRTAVVLTINAAPEAPVSSGDITECEASPLQTLNANDALASTTGITWYTTATGEEIAENPTLSSVGDVTFYAEYNDGACTSLSRTAVKLTITGAPEAPSSSGDITECEASPLQTLNANEALASTTGITWYTAATGGTVVENPTLSAVGDVTYYAEYNDGTCTSLTRTAVTLTITGAPEAPASSGDITECEASPLQTLNANDALASTTGIIWYTTATGEEIAENPTLSSVGDVTFYAEYNDGTCTSLTRTAVKLTITGAPEAPQANDQTVCFNGDENQILTATATGGTITWYDAASDGNIVSNPTQVGVGSSTYYAESANENNCTSLTRTPVVLTIIEDPEAPVSNGNITECEQTEIQTLNANDALASITGIIWYTTATGEEIAENPTLSSVGDVTYYAEYNDGACTSLTRTAVKLTITGAPEAPASSGDITECEASPLQTLNANDALASTTGITWYTTAAGEEIAENPTLSSVGDVTYYAEYNDGACTSLSRTAVKLTITGAPEAPASSGDITECEASPLQTLNANDALASTTGITWYTTATGEEIAENPTLSSVGDVTYYAEYNDGACTSLSRTAVKLTITGAPEAPTSSGDITECEASPLQTLNANDALTSTTGITWYTTATGEEIAENPTLSSVGDVTFYAEYNDGTCTSLTRTAVKLAITGAPEAPASSGDITECEASPLQTLNANDALASTTGITWYTTATGEEIAENPTLSSVGDVTFYAEYNDGTCTSLTRTAVKLTINSTPLSPVVNTTQPTCETATGSFSVTAISGLEYSFNGGNFGSAVSFADLNPGTYTVVARNAAGCESEATPVTINAQPATPASPVVVSTTQPTCEIATGSFSVTAVSGLEYSFNGGNFGSAVSFADLNPGTYTVVARNAAGCESEAASVTINAQPATPASPVVVSTTQPTCETATGSFSVTAVSGLEYSFNGGNFGSAVSFTDLNPGTYTVIARNAAGCESESTSVTINAQPATPASPVVVSTTQPTCETATGSFNVTAVSGLEYSFNGSNFGSAVSFTDLNPGTYTVVARNAAGCESEAASVTINAQPATPASPVVVSTTQPTCETATGSFSVTAVSGLEYSFNGGNFGSAVSFADLNPGTYTVIARNATGCESEAASVTINAQPATTASPVVASTTQPTCETATGSFSVTAVSGLEYSLNGGTFGSAVSFADLNPGTYTVIARNAAGCESETTSVTINAQPTTLATPVIASTTQPDCEVTTGSFSITPVSGLTYSFNGGEFGSTTSFEGLVSGTYTITARNEAGCESETVSVIIEEAPVNVVVADPSFICDDGGVYDLNSLISGGENAVSGIWVDTDQTGTLNNGVIDPTATAPGFYTFTYAIEGNCPSTTDVTLEIRDCFVGPCELSDIKDSVSKAVTPNGDGFNDFLTIGIDLACEFTYAVKIFNRWGAEIYKDNNYNNNWDGYSNKSVTSSNQLPSGTYYYILEVTDKDGNRLEPIQGYIYLGTK